MAATAPPLSSPVAAAPLPPLPTPNRPSSAPTTGTANAASSSSLPLPPVEHVSEAAYEFLLSEIIQWVERDEKRLAEEARRVHQQQQQQEQQQEDQPPSSATEEATGNPSDEAAAVMAAERSAARIERMGYDVGYRLCERLAQHRPLWGPGSPSPEVGGTEGGSGGNPLVMGGGAGQSSVTGMDPKTQLEAVKFLCKEFWTEVFRKQIDKLQTNHRGVFVLKDLELKWLRRLPPDEESARVGAIRMLAFPCGLIRGALACLGLGGAVVSCDFLADGKTMASCSFNIKVK
ncbi:hypothetical protein HJC23_011808 [Cyclotella cryptica]|uniref:Transport protein particle component n=1 Tax=Cyclotella cryptica TaxID=29204 RepID=A0ABD3NSS6_9STRA|eukprot:CCRYP_019942-RA/>CCRYP_019942-RA protein AED:0.05 eAED:0.05 QI:170/1/1/1/0.5/0.33/3/198/288